MRTVRAPRGTRTTEPHFGTPAAEPAAEPAPKRFRELDPEDVQDCTAAQGQAYAAQVAIFTAMREGAATIQRIRGLAEHLAEMTGRHAVDEQLDSAERCAMNTMMRLTEMLVEIRCEEAKAEDAETELLRRAHVI